MERLQESLERRSSSLISLESLLIIQKVGKQDLERLNEIPCIRQSLLYGIGGGVGLGAVRMFGSGRTYKSWKYGQG